MTYNYRADVTMTIDMAIEASSYAMAEELVQQYLAPVSDDSRVVILAPDSITVDQIESDDDPADDEE